MTVYLDMSATTPVSTRVAGVVLRHMTEEFGNAGSRTHERGSAAKRAVAAARSTIATSVACSSEEVVFTSGATESNNLALLGLASYGRERGRMHILSSATEHKAVLEPLQQLERQGFEVELMQPDMSGRYDPADVLARIRPDTLALSLMHVNNETGVIQPVEELADRLAQSPTFFHVDAAQSYTKVEPHTLHAPIDLLSISGHKIGAPMGVGALITRRRGWNKVPLEPLMFGGGQERKLRPGTLPVPLILGLAEAVKERTEGHPQWLKETLSFRQAMLELIGGLGGVVNGSSEHTAPHILNVSFPGVDSEALIVALRGVADVATGSACTSATYTPSHVLSAMGLEPARIEGSIRLSWWGRPTDDLEPLHNTLRSLMPQNVATTSSS